MVWDILVTLAALAACALAGRWLWRVSGPHGNDTDVSGRGSDGAPRDDDDTSRPSTRGPRAS